MLCGLQDVLLSGLLQLRAQNTHNLGHLWGGDRGVRPWAHPPQEAFQRRQSRQL